VSSALLQHIGARQALTAEQRLRGGADGTPDWVVLVNGYSVDAIAEVAASELDDAQLSARGAAPGALAERYRLACVLAASGYTQRPEEAR
jgi:hypothetical protein